MSDDNEMPNAGAPGDEDRHENGVTPSPSSDAPSQSDDSEPRYDAAGAALGALSQSEEAEVYAAAAADPSVSADLAAMEGVAAELARLSPTTVMNRGRSAGIRSRLVARAAATHASRPLPKNAVPEITQHTPRSAAKPDAAPSTSPRTPTASVSASSRRAQHSAPPSGSATAARRVTGTHAIPFEPRSRTGLGRILGTAALAAAILIAAFGVYDWRSQKRLGRTESAAGATDSTLNAQIASLRASVAQKDSLIAALTGMHTRVIDLVAYNSADPMARIFWDQKKQMFMMYASNLSMPPAGKTYQVWLIPRGAPPVSAGTFMPDSAGSAIMVAKHPMEPGTLRRIAVTEEPDGGAASPTGAVVFAGVGR